MNPAYGTLLDALRGVRWPARRAVAAALPGAHRSRQRGTAGEFTEYRLYRQGDDPKQLDWKLLARSDRAFVRLTDDRALLPTWLLVDGSASMDFPASDPLSKWNVAAALAVGLAAVAHAAADPVGVVCTAVGGATRLTPRTRRGTVNEIARVLDDATVGGESALAPAFATFAPTARIVVLTDLLGDLDALVTAAAQHVAAGATVECVHIVAAAELDPPAGVRLARDPESLATERTMDRRSVIAYRDAFARFRNEAARRWRAAGAGYLEVVTDSPLPKAVRQIVSGQSHESATERA